jgi:hypothetical protein
VRLQCTSTSKTAAPALLSSMLNATIAGPDGGIIGADTSATWMCVCTPCASTSLFYWEMKNVAAQCLYIARWASRYDARSCDDHTEDSFREERRRR